MHLYPCCVPDPGIAHEMIVLGQADILRHLATLPRGGEGLEGRLYAGLRLRAALASPHGLQRVKTEHDVRRRDLERVGVRVAQVHSQRPPVSFEQVQDPSK